MSSFPHRCRVRTFVLLAILLGAFLMFQKGTVHGLEHFFGFAHGYGDSPQYLFWSGVGSNFAYVGFIATAIIYYRRNNCRMKWCPLLGHHEFTIEDPKTKLVYKVCWHHHPHMTKENKHLKKSDLQERFHLYVGDRPGEG